MYKYNVQADAPDITITSRCRLLAVIHMQTLDVKHHIRIAHHTMESDHTCTATTHGAKHN